MLRKFIAHRIIDGCVNFVERTVERAIEKRGGLDKDSQEYKDYQAAMQDVRNTLKGRKSR